MVQQVQTYIEIAAAIAFPLLAFVINWQIRIHRRYALSAAADFMLAVATFDVTAAAAHAPFEKVVRYQPFREDFVGLFLILFANTIVSWMVFFLPLEDRLINAYQPSSGGKFTGNAAIYFFGSWFLVAALVAPHFFVFLYG
jgi:hypothetical protein